jgi:hypothetical protein
MYRGLSLLNKTIKSKSYGLTSLEKDREQGGEKE